MKVSKEEIAAAYWAFEKPWQEYRKKTGDKRDASKCGNPAVAAAAQRFLPLMKQWEAENPIDSGFFWGIALPSGEPLQMKGAEFVRRPSWRKLLPSD